MVNRGAFKFWPNPRLPHFKFFTIELELLKKSTSTGKSQRRQQSISEERWRMTREDPLHILLTNDDGIYADGLWALYDAIHSRHNVVVVAPDRERSAVGHGITLQHPIRAAQITVPGGSKGWSVSGTPADCVKLAIGELLETRPDLVISGINPGANVGVNLNYSGTVAAAREAALYGIAAMAVSVQVHDRPVYDLATRCVARLVPLLSANGLAPGIFLNINVPAAPPDKTVGILPHPAGARNG
jgi:5'-nucleotidase